jgi:IS5 family transposase
MLLLQFLYDIPDRACEEAVNLNMAFKYFCGLDYDEKGPDATTLVRFRDRLGADGCRDLFNGLVSIARKKGIIADRLSLVDSSHIKAKVDTYKNPPRSGKGPDKDARGGYKSSKKPFFGYKCHIAEDYDSELITKVLATPGNVYDGEVFVGVCDENAKAVTADRGYSSADNRWILKENGQVDGIIPRSNDVVIDDVRVKIMKLRKNVERKISELKMHGLGSARYWGSAKMEIQAMLTAWAVNIKRMVKFKTGLVRYRKKTNELKGISRHRMRNCMV